MTKLAVIVHENDEVTVKDERGVPVVCKDCRYAGWLTEWEFREFEFPRTCLHYSGGADPREGDRVILDEVKNRSEHEYFCDERRGWRARYPMCSVKNANGNCSDFVRAHPILVTWWGGLRMWLSPKLRQTMRRRLRT
jgi:hypothetical protein